MQTGSLLVEPFGAMVASQGLQSGAFLLKQLPSDKTDPSPQDLYGLDQWALVPETY